MGAPVRPNPVITSSKISRIPCRFADLAQALQVPARRDQHTGGTGRWARRSTAAILDASCSITSRSSSSAQLRPVRRRAAAREKAFLAGFMRVRQVVDAR